MSPAINELQSRFIYAVDRIYGPVSIFYCPFHSLLQFCTLPILYIFSSPMSFPLLFIIFILSFFIFFAHILCSYFLLIIVFVNIVFISIATYSFCSHFLEKNESSIKIYPYIYSFILEVWDHPIEEIIIFYNYSFFLSLSYYIHHRRL